MTVGYLLRCNLELMYIDNDDTDFVSMIIMIMMLLLQSLFFGTTWEDIPKVVWEVQKCPSPG